MLRDLHFNYLTYTAMLFSAIVAGLIGFPIWGRHADLAGNASILRITGLLIPVIPLLWLISRHPLYIFVIQAFSGFVWSGFNLCATNFIYDAVTPAKRVRCLGYFNLINGCAIFAGAALGGFLGDRLPLLGGFSLTTLFLLSSLLRFLAYFTLSPKFQEVRESAKKVSSTDLFFSVLGIRSITGLNAEENIASSSVNEPS
jgi:predicted MFS family arabinose efflux permease